MIFSPVRFRFPLKNDGIWFFEVDDFFTFLLRDATNRDDLKGQAVSNPPRVRALPVLHGMERPKPLSYIL